MTIKELNDRFATSEIDIYYVYKDLLYPIDINRISMNTEVYEYTYNPEKMRMVIFIDADKEGR